MIFRAGFRLLTNVFVRLANKGTGLRCRSLSRRASSASSGSEGGVGISRRRYGLAVVEEDASGVLARGRDLTVGFLGRAGFGIDCLEAFLVFFFVSLPRAEVEVEGESEKFTGGGISKAPESIESGVGSGAKV
jgi:hypothetical protein